MTECFCYKCRKRCGLIGNCGALEIRQPIRLEERRYDGRRRPELNYMHSDLLFFSSNRTARFLPLWQGPTFVEGVDVSNKKKPENET
jgi:hypothetical protein